MKLLQIIQAVEAETLVTARGHAACDIVRVVASDLMSDVLVSATDNMLLVTSLASDQALHTAYVVGAAAVLIVNGKVLPAGMDRLARDMDITLARTTLPKFECCVRIGILMSIA